MSGLGAAWRFLTRVPIGRADGDPAVMDRAPQWFPTVGALIGAVAGACYALAEPLLGPTPAAALAVTAGALLTGAFHHDGLADIADAYGGGWDVEQRLAILKDSRHGTYGVMALVCVVVVQVSALASADRWQGLTLLVAAHSGARAGALALVRWAPRARTAGLGGPRPATTPVIVALGGAAAFQVLLLGALAAWSIAAVTVAVLAVHLLSRRKVGGVTGDALGAAEQVAETAVLVCGAAFAQHAGAWPWWR